MTSIFVLKTFRTTYSRTSRFFFLENRTKTVGSREVWKKVCAELRDGAGVEKKMSADKEGSRRQKKKHKKTDRRGSIEKLREENWE